MRIAIIGAGAIGGVFGFYLAAAAEVVLIDPWPAHVAAILSGGLRCEIDGVDQVRDLQAVSDPADAGVCDLALVLVKAAQTPWAAQAAQAVLSPGGVAYTLQNGLGNAEVLAALLGAQRVGRGVTSLGGTLLGPGRVRHAGMGPTLLGAEPLPELAESFVQVLQAAGLSAEVRTDIESLVWGKLLVNVAINPLTALLRVPNGDLTAIPQARDLLTRVVQEAAAVAAARGTPLPYADPPAHVLAVAEATALNRSSMLQDVQRGTKTEIETITGALVREGERLGVATPLNALLLDLVRAIDACIR